MKSWMSAVVAVLCVLVYALSPPFVVAILGHHRIQPGTPANKFLLVFYSPLEKFATVCPPYKELIILEGKMLGL